MRCCFLATEQQMKFLHRFFLLFGKLTCEKFCNKILLQQSEIFCFWSWGSNFYHPGSIHMESTFAWVG